MPRLKQLELSDSKFNWVDSSLPTTLTVLKIRRSPNDKLLETPTAALDVLASLPSLRVLSITDAIPHMPSTSTSTRTVSLPHLARLELESNNPEDSANFLESLSFPSETTIHLECLVGSVEHVNGIARVISSKYPPSNVRMGAICLKACPYYGSDGVYIEVYGSPVTATEGVEEKHEMETPSLSKRFSLNLIVAGPTVVPEIPHEINGHGVVHALHHAFRSLFKPITTLTLDQFKFPTEVQDLHKYLSDSLRSLVNIRKMVVKGQLAGLVPKILSPSTPLPMSPSTAGSNSQAPNPETRVIFPHLTELCFEDYRATGTAQDLCGELLDTLTERKSRHNQNLMTLSFTTCGIAVRWGLARRLRDVVSHIILDGKEKWADGEGGVDEEERLFGEGIEKLRTLQLAGR